MTLLRGREAVGLRPERFVNSTIVEFLRAMVACVRFFTALVDARQVCGV